jgi:hypothetical protein
MKPHLLIFVLFAFSSSAFALIGEDAKQIEARYGKPMQVLTDRGDYREVGYNYREFMLVVRFLGGISKQEGFARRDKSMLSPDTIKQFLEISAPPSVTWRELPVKDGNRFWERSDGTAKAILPVQGNFFIVQDPKFVEPK